MAASPLTLDIGLDFDRTLPGERPRLRAVPPDRSPSPDLPRRPTLDDMVVGVWEGLCASRTAACPICSGTMVPVEIGAGGVCGDCSTALV